MEENAQIVAIVLAEVSHKDIFVLKIFLQVVGIVLYLLFSVLPEAEIVKILLKK